MVSWGLVWKPCHKKGIMPLYHLRSFESHRNGTIWPMAIYHPNHWGTPLKYLISHWLVMCTLPQCLRTPSQYLLSHPWMSNTLYKVVVEFRILHQCNHDCKALKLDHQSVVMLTEDLPTQCRPQPSSPALPFTQLRNRILN